MISSDDWKDEVRKKLVVILENDEEKLMRIFWYLDNEDSVYFKHSQLHFVSTGIALSDMQVPPVWRTLKALLNSDASFKLYAERIAEDSKRAETDPLFRETMNQIYAEMMQPSDDALPEDEHNDFDMVRLNDPKVGAVALSLGLLRSWSMIPVEFQGKILDMIPQIVMNRNVVTSLDELVGFVNRTGGSIVMVTLAAVYLTFDAIYNIYRWWNGKISGKRCAKNVVDSCFAVGSGMLGGIAGAAVGSFVGPIGTMVGGILGGIITGQAANFLIDRLTQELFGIPKDEALENAYNYFGVKMSASNSEINTSFRKMCLKHHPDKGGKSDDFHFVQVNMSVIKLARGTYA